MTFTQVNQLRNRYAALADQYGVDAAETIKAHGKWRKAVAAWSTATAPAFPMSAADARIAARQDAQVTR